MNTSKNNKQKGMTTLVISMILLFGISLIALFSTKSIILEKKISANNYRSEQALFRADGALNFISAQLDSLYPNAKLLYQNQKLDNESALLVENHLDSLAQLVNMSIATDVNHIQVLAYSDDKSSIRQLSQLQAATPIAGNGAGKIVTYPLISHFGIDYAQKMFINNQFSANTIWSGGKVQLDLSSKTYIPLIAIDKQSTEQFLASGEDKNNGIDIFEQDFKLQQLNNDQFFENFLNENASFIKYLATNNQHYFSANDAQNINTKNGLIWLGDGGQNISLDNAEIGTAEKPVIMVVDTSQHEFTTRGEIIIYGLLYIRGDWHPNGNIIVNGAVIVEGKIMASDDIDLVNISINYSPDRLKHKIPIASTTARVIGSWKDF